MHHNSMRNSTPRRAYWRGAGTSLLLLMVVMLSWGAGVSSGLAAPLTQHVQLPTTEITVGGVPLLVELAVDAGDQARGLSNRDGLAPGAGMLFAYAEPASRSFWMKGMRFCLDIIWIEDDQIQGAAENVCPAAPEIADAELPVYTSPVPVTYVLEVPAGWLTAHGLGPGVVVKGLPVL